MFTGCPKSFCHHPQRGVSAVSIDSIVKSILIDPRFINFDGAHASDLENVAATRRWNWWNCPVDVQGSKYIDKNRWLMNINDHYKYKPL
jgi:hypothetical protein